ncbi:MAG: hypothetical protein LBT79_00145 [Elusimicrobiota bacterium]|jgi:hypothetical protein|nr:hypothetical protein [Elusimicrobiota bacterium]
MKKSVFILSFLVFILSGVFLYFAVEFLSKDKENDIINLNIEKAKTSIYASVSQINKSIDNSDEMGLLISSQLLSKTENISSVYITDKAGGQIIPNNAANLNGEYDEAEQNAKNSQTDLVQKTQEKNIVLISVPLSQGYTLFCLLSTQSSVKYAHRSKIVYYVGAGVFDLLIFILMYILSKIFIIFPFNRKTKALQKAKDDIKSMDKSVSDKEMENKKNSDIASSLQKENKNLTAIINYFSKEALKEQAVFIILDSDNNIICAFDKTSKILREDFQAGDNISKSVLSEDFLKAVKKSNSQLHSNIEYEVDSISLSIISIAYQETLSAVIICGK